MRRRRKHSRDCKIETVKLVREHGVTVFASSLHLSIHSSIIVSLGYQCYAIDLFQSARLFLNSDIEKRHCAKVGGNRHRQSL